MAGGKIRVNIHNNLEPFSEAAALAEEQFGIRPQAIRVRSRGTISEEQVILGAAFRCGVQKVVVPFFDYGMQVEYELIRSINTVARNERKTIGVVRDRRPHVRRDHVYPRPGLPAAAACHHRRTGKAVRRGGSGPDPAGRSGTLRYALGRPALLAAAGTDGAFDSSHPARPADRPLRRPPALLAALWQLCARHRNSPREPRHHDGAAGAAVAQGRCPAAVERVGDPGTRYAGRDGLYQPHLVWQRYNPYPNLQIDRPDQVVFVREDSEQDEQSAGLLNADNLVTSGLLELVFPFPGAIEPQPNSPLKFTKLVTTRDPSGTIGYEQFAQHQDDGMLQSYQVRTDRLTIAAMIEDDSQSKQNPDQPAKQAPPAVEPATQAKNARPLKVLYCADIDLMVPTFLQIRARPDEENIRWGFENVTFLLNAIDVLAGETEYIDIRKRKPLYATLQVVESRTEEAKAREFSERSKYQAKYDQEMQQAELEKAETLEKYQDMVNDLLKQQREGIQVNEAELIEKQQRLMLKQDVLNRRSTISKERLDRELKREITRIQRDVDLEIQRMQFKYKFLAVAIPWIPPFLVGLVVFVRRRLREREGIEKSRLR